MEDKYISEEELKELQQYHEMDIVQAAQIDNMQWLKDLNIVDGCEKLFCVDSMDYKNSIYVKNKAIFPDPVCKDFVVSHLIEKTFRDIRNAILFRNYKLDGINCVTARMTDNLFYKSKLQQLTDIIIKMVNSLKDPSGRIYLFIDRDEYSKLIEEHKINSCTHTMNGFENYIKAISGINVIVPISNFKKMQKMESTNNDVIAVVMDAKRYYLFGKDIYFRDLPKIDEKDTFQDGTETKEYTMVYNIGGQINSDNYAVLYQYSY